MSVLRSNGFESFHKTSAVTTLAEAGRESFCAETERDANVVVKNILDNIQSVQHRVIAVTSTH